MRPLQSTCKMKLIYIVEDNEDIANAYLRRFKLGEFDCAVHIFDRVKDAMTAVKEKDHPDLIICDMQLVGRLRGDEFLAWIGERHPELLPRIVFCSGNPMDRQNLDYDVPWFWKGSDSGRFELECNRILKGTYVAIRRISETGNADSQAWPVKARSTP